MCQAKKPQEKKKRWHCGKGKIENRETGILEEQAWKATRLLKNDKSPGVDNVPVEVIKLQTAIDPVTVICQKI